MIYKLFLEINSHLHYNTNSNTINFVFTNYILIAASNLNHKILNSRIFKWYLMIGLYHPNKNAKRI